MTQISSTTGLIAAGILYTIISSFTWAIYGHLTGLRYDRVDPGCAYFKRDTDLDGAYWATLLINLLLSLITGLAIELPWPFLVGLVHAAIQAVAYIYMVLRRSVALERVLSVRYMQHKYGCNFDALMLLLDRHDLGQFPIANFEQRLNLSSEATDAYTAEEDVRDRMDALVQCDFVQSLSRASPPAEHLALYGAQWKNMAHTKKITKIMSDYYASKKTSQSQ